MGIDNVADKTGQISNTIFDLREEIKTTPQIHTLASMIEDVKYAWERADEIHAYDLANDALRMLVRAINRSKWNELTETLKALERPVCDLTWAIDAAIVPE